MISTTRNKSISLDEFLRQPETKPGCEYIDGEIQEKPVPKGKHSLLQTRLSARINQISEPSKLEFALTELRCTFAECSLVPDIAVFYWQNIPLDEDGEIANQFDKPPDWTIEILSPEQRQTRVICNILFCLNAGTELGWLIDPQELMILVFQSGQQPEIKQGDDEVPGLNNLTHWIMSANQIFDLLKFN
ncbi:hypothetical protein AY600_09135 [Phormidium willei BDU 130791]|nr:hypothetical protein AY600_09135 [Phormidium willei BDU 130791]